MKVGASRGQRTAQWQPGPNSGSARNAAASPNSSPRVRYASLPPPMGSGVSNLRRRRVRGRRASAAATAAWRRACGVPPSAPSSAQSSIASTAARSSRSVNVRGASVSRWDVSIRRCRRVIAMMSAASSSGANRTGVARWPSSERPHPSATRREPSAARAPAGASTPAEPTDTTSVPRRWSACSWSSAASSGLRPTLDVQTTRMSSGFPSAVRGCGRLSRCHQPHSRSGHRSGADGRRPAQERWGCADTLVEARTADQALVMGACSRSSRPTSTSGTMTA